MANVELTSYQWNKILTFLRGRSEFYVGRETHCRRAVDAHEMPVNVRVTARTVADCAQAEALLDGIPLDVAAADRGYDTNKVVVVAMAQARGLTPVIPPKRNRKVAREYDKALYQARHLVENGLERFKE